MDVGDNVSFFQRRREQKEKKKKNSIDFESCQGVFSGAAPSPPRPSPPSILARAADPAGLGRGSEKDKPTT